MRTTLTYIFDPLCGWCYGASPAIQHLADDPNLHLELAPSGLFSGGDRTMDATFSDYAWRNDQRIHQLTGQPFSAAYRSRVLGEVGGRFDSAPTTLALTAVQLTAPDNALAVLRALQTARYVDGVNTSTVPIVAQLLIDWGYSAAAARLAGADPELLQANSLRIAQTQQRMRQFGIQGVPALVRTDASGSRLVSSQWLFGNLENLRAELAQD